MSFDQTVCEIERTPWPQNGIEKYKSIDDGPWGYLIFLSDGSHYFDVTKRPADHEILERWGYLLNGITK